MIVHLLLALVASAGAQTPTCVSLNLDSDEACQAAGSAKYTGQIECGYGGNEVDCSIDQCCRPYRTCASLGLYDDRTCQAGKDDMLAYTGLLSCGARDCEFADCCFTGTTCVSLGLVSDEACAARGFGAYADVVICEDGRNCEESDCCYSAMTCGEAGFRSDESCSGAGFDFILDPEGPCLGECTADQCCGRLAGCARSKLVDDIACAIVPDADYDQLVEGAAELECGDEGCSAEQCCRKSIGCADLGFTDDATCNTASEGQLPFLTDPETLNCGPGRPMDCVLGQCCRRAATCSEAGLQTNEDCAAIDRATILLNGGGDRPCSDPLGVGCVVGDCCSVPKTCAMRGLTTDEECQNEASADFIVVSADRSDVDKLCGPNMEFACAPEDCCSSTVTCEESGFVSDSNCQAVDGFERLLDEQPAACSPGKMCSAQECCADNTVLVEGGVNTVGTSHNLPPSGTEESVKLLVAGVAVCCLTISTGLTMIFNSFGGLHWTRNLADAGMDCLLAMHARYHLLLAEALLAVGFFFLNRDMSGYSVHPPCDVTGALWQVSLYLLVMVVIYLMIRMRYMLRWELSVALDDKRAELWVGHFPVISHEPVDLDDGSGMRVVPGLGTTAAHEPWLLHRREERHRAWNWNKNLVSMFLCLTWALVIALFVVIWLVGTTAEETGDGLYCLYLDTDYVYLTMLVPLAAAFLICLGLLVVNGKLLTSFCLQADAEQRTNSIRRGYVFEYVTEVVGAFAILLYALIVLDMANSVAIAVIVAAVIMLVLLFVMVLRMAAIWDGMVFGLFKFPCEYLGQLRKVSWHPSKNDMVERSSSEMPTSSATGTVETYVLHGSFTSDSDNSSSAAGDLARAARDSQEVHDAYINIDEVQTSVEDDYMEPVKMKKAAVARPTPEESYAHDMLLGLRSTTSHQSLECSGAGMTRNTLQVEIENSRRSIGGTPQVPAYLALPAHLEDDELTETETMTTITVADDPYERD
eukprot:Clim_evm3s151 gene=Clim_evmTU3s151